MGIIKINGAEQREDCLKARCTVFWTKYIHMPHRLTSKDNLWQTKLNVLTCLQRHASQSLRNVFQDSCQRNEENNN